MINKSRNATACIQDGCVPLAPVFEGALMEVADTHERPTQVIANPETIITAGRSIAMNRAFFRKICREIHMTLDQTMPQKPHGVIKKIIPTRHQNKFLFYRDNSIFLYDRLTQGICFKGNCNIMPWRINRNVSDDGMSSWVLRIYFDDGRVEEIEIPSSRIYSPRVCIDEITNKTSCFFSSDIIPYLPTIINSFNPSNIPVVKITNKIGANTIDGNVSYVFKDGRIDHTGEIKVDIISKPIDIGRGFDPYANLSVFPEIGDKEREAFIFFWEKFITQDRIENVLIWAYAFSAVNFYRVAESFGEMGTYLYIEGQTESGKTTRCRHILNFFGKFCSIDSLLTFDATMTGLMSATSMITGIPIIIDDFRQSDLSNAQQREVQRMLDGIGNRASRTRARSNGRPARSSGIAPHAIITGENPLPFEAGALNRGISMHFPENGYPLSESEKDLYESEYAPRLHPWFITFLKYALPLDVNQVQREIKAIASQLEEAYIARGGKNEKKRTVKYLSTIYYTFICMMKLFQTIMQLPNVDLIRSRFWDYLLEILANQLLQVKQMNPGDQFIEEMKIKRTGGIKVIPIRSVNGKTLVIETIYSTRDLLILYHDCRFYFNVKRIFAKYKLMVSRAAVTHCLREAKLLNQEYSYENASTNLPKYTLHLKQPDRNTEDEVREVVHGIEMYVISGDKIGWTFDDAALDHEGETGKTFEKENHIDICLE